MQAPADLFIPGAELFLENFREISLFEAQVLENVKSRGVFEWMQRSVSETLLGVTSKSILVGQRINIYTFGLTKSPTKISEVYDIQDVLQCRHKEGDGGWLEIIYKNGAKLRVIMNSRQTECVALITKHVGGGTVRIQEPEGKGISTGSTNDRNNEVLADKNGKDEDSTPPALSGDASETRQGSGDDNVQPTTADIKDLMKEYTS